MINLKNTLLTLLLTGTLLLGGCTDAAPAPSTPQEAVECTMNSIKALDMATLNEYTDNYVQTIHHWSGVPIENEYRTFNELLQPQSKNTRRYQTALELNQKMVEQLTWEITAVREDGDTAEIDMVVTNIDMQKVMEQLPAQILGDILKTPYLGVPQIITKTVTSSVQANEAMISLIDALDDNDICTNTVTALAYREQGQWKVHLTHDFINAFSGNLYADIDSEAIAELEEQVDRMAEEWADSIEERMNSWMEQFE
ncbi:MAG: hypothetical protein K2P39_08340 [Lachnospiraceae bacterium]|nr:hypothetical protein [Lachnospiraceae bacterium]